jgi:hypothetical protein
MEKPRSFQNQSHSTESVRRVEEAWSAPTYPRRTTSPKDAFVAQDPRLSEDLIQECSREPGEWTVEVYAVPIPVPVCMYALVELQFKI